MHSETIEEHIKTKVLSVKLHKDLQLEQSPENVQFFLGTARTFQKLPTFLRYFLHCLVFFGKNGCTYCFITIFFCIFASNNRKKYPKCNISLVKYQIFLLFIKFFLGTWFLGSSENLDSELQLRKWKFFFIQIKHLKLKTIWVMYLCLSRMIPKQNKTKSSPRLKILVKVGSLTTVYQCICVKSYPFKSTICMYFFMNFTHLVCRNDNLCILQLQVHSLC